MLPKGKQKGSIGFKVDFEELKRMGPWSQHKYEESLNFFQGVERESTVKSH